MFPDNDDARYLALKARDARFDGRFFTGVTSTGIYCRPVCRVRAPKRENCRFFDNAAQAEAAGFRPCLLCRPELAPHAHGMPWSREDATRVLAHAAAQLIDASPGHESPASVAQRLGVSERHLRRLFQAHWGIAPLQYLQTRRLLAAKLMLTSTALPVAEVARLSGFGSERRFHATWRARYGLPPLQLRRQLRNADGARAGAGDGLRLNLSWRPPLDADHLLGFLAQRALDGVELAIPARAEWGSTLRVLADGREHLGWVHARLDTTSHTVRLTVAPELQAVLPEVLRRVRDTLDLDLTPEAVDALLGADFPDSEGRRVPGVMDGFALAVRAVLGQQVSVAAARTLALRLVHRWGVPLPHPRPGLTHAFPTPQSLWHASADELGALGLTRQRQQAVRALAAGVLDGTLRLSPAPTDVPATLDALRALPGVGDWTAQYIAMRALRWPDAFPSGDVALHHALGLHSTSLRERQRQAEARAQAWRPWRAYAVVRAWSQGIAPSSASPASSTARRT